MNKIVKIAFLSLLLGGCGERTYDPDNDVHGAWAYMQLFVEKRLKSPSTADFPHGGSRDVEPLGNGRYRIVSYVDAQNAFGGTVRTNFRGIIKRVDGGWELENLKLE